MITLNGKAAGIAANGKFQIHAATDITGFGLIGHLREMAKGSGLSAVINAADIPLIEGALDCVRAGFIPGGLNANRDFAECLVGYDDGVSQDVRTMLFDPQTAGGLLLAVAEKDAAALVEAMNAEEVPAVEIGSMGASTKPLIHVR
jgi:selenide,water dikinase